MKETIWRKVYVPQWSKLDLHVRTTLNALKNEKAGHPKRTWAMAVALTLVFAAAAALAAGIVYSASTKLEARALEILEKEYGLTARMQAFFRCSVDEKARSVVLEPYDAGIIDDRLGVYTVRFEHGKTMASWSYDGQACGDDLTSSIWNAALLDKALERKAQGEEWFEILCAPEQLTVGVTEEEAAEIARKAIEERFGKEALNGCSLLDSHSFIDMDAADGHGVRRYSVSYGSEEEGTGVVYKAILYADNGAVSECRLVEGKAEEERAPDMENRNELESMSGLAREEILALARQALAQRYALSEERAESMELIDCVYWKKEDALLCSASFWIWTQPEGEWSEGDGVYSVDINAETGVIENVCYDSTLNGNG